MACPFPLTVPFPCIDTRRRMADYDPSGKCTSHASCGCYGHPCCLGSKDIPPCPFPVCLLEQSSHETERRARHAEVRRLRADKVPVQYVVRLTGVSERHVYRLSRVND